jgi:UrcA family protein
MIRTVALCALALSLASPSFAAGEDAAPSVHVRYTDADFASPAATRAFFNRLRYAAHQVCDREDRNLASMQQRMNCERRALDRAVAQINRAELYALYTPSTTVRVAGRGR